MDISFKFQARVVVSFTVAFFLAYASGSFATTNYSVRASAFSKYGSDTSNPDPVVLENAGFSTAMSATAIGGYPTSFGIASITSGSVRGGAAALGDLPGGEFGQGSFRAEIRDFVTFDLPDGMTSATIKAILDLSGTIQSNPGVNGEWVENWQVNGRLTLGRDGEGGIIAQDGLYDYNNPLFTHTLSAEWDVVDGEAIYLNSWISASADATSAGILLDFSLPGSNIVRLEMPEGTTFTSASGALLTAVPVPAPLFLLLSGVIALISRGRRANK